MGAHVVDHRNDCSFVRCRTDKSITRLNGALQARDFGFACRKSARGPASRRNRFTASQFSEM
jgi:hypothetical protein